jgi:N-acetylneuraminic acid mutarotase
MNTDNMRQLNTSLLILGCLLTAATTKAQFSMVWHQLEDLPYAVYSPYMFAVDGRIFVGDGITGSQPLTYASGMNEYDPVMDTWTARTPCPGADRYGARGFGLNGLGYMTCGWSNDNPVVQLNDTWAYDPATDSWSQKADFPGGARYTAITCATSTKGYTGLGYTPYYGDWWEYDPLADQWTQRATFPGAPRQSAISFVIDDQVYVGCGASSNTTALNDLWRYEPASDTWTQLASLPADVRYTSYSFTYDQKGFVVCGLTVDQFANFTAVAQVWYYDPTTDSWTQMADFPGAPRGEGASCWSNGLGYLGFGRFSFGAGPLSANITSEFWRVRPVEMGVNEDAMTDALTVRMTADGLLLMQPGTSPMPYAVLDATGRWMSTGTVAPLGSAWVPTAGWSPGVYLVKAGNGKAERVVLP